MAASNSPIRSPQPNRRGRVRHQIQTPAFASFTTETKGGMLDLHEIVNISEDGIAIQCHTPLEKGRKINLCLDLSECSDHIYTTGQVVWTNPAGRAGLRFSEMRPLSLFRLREWLFLNAMAGVANADDFRASLHGQVSIPIRPSYTDSLAAVSAVQREVEALGRDLDAALQLLASRTETLVRASGVAIALSEADPDYMTCRASAGPLAPPAGVRLQLGSGFSGECLKSGRLLRCDDTEADSRVDRESCRALGIRSMIAVPVRASGQPIGILEVFSADANAFGENDNRVVQRLAETVAAAANRAGRGEIAAPAATEPAKPFAIPPGSVLFASKAETKKEPEANDTGSSPGVNLPHSALVLLVAAAATIALGLGYRLAPWLQSEVVPWAQAKLHARGSAHLTSVLASTHAPGTNSGIVETATIEQLKQMAEKGDPVAQNSLGLRFVSGDGVKTDEREAALWFTKSAEQGNVAAQSKLGAMYWGGRGVPANYNEAYFWTVLARAGGDQASKDRAPLVAARLTRAQVTSIELQANTWLEDRSGKKPRPGH